LVDDICMIYKEGWRKQKNVHNTLGMLIFGYAEKGWDTKLKKKLDDSKSFKEMYELALGANAEHEEGIVKKIAKEIDEQVSDSALSDSIWCQSKVLVETLKERLEPCSPKRLCTQGSAIAKFLFIAEKIIKVLKLVMKQPFLKKIVELVEMVVKFVQRVITKSFNQVNKLTMHPGYTKGKIFFFPIIF